MNNACEVGVHGERERDTTFSPFAKKPLSAVIRIMMPFSSSVSMFWSCRFASNSCVNKGVENCSSNASFYRQSGVNIQTPLNKTCAKGVNKIGMGRMTAQARKVMRICICA